MGAMIRHGLSSAQVRHCGGRIGLYPPVGYKLRGGRPGNGYAWRCLASASRLTRLNDDIKYVGWDREDIVKWYERSQWILRGWEKRGEPWEGRRGTTTTGNGKSGGRIWGNAQDGSGQQKRNQTIL